MLLNVQHKFCTGVKVVNHYFFAANAIRTGVLMGLQGLPLGPPTVYQHVVFTNPPESPPLTPQQVLATSTPWPDVLPMDLTLSTSFADVTLPMMEEGD